MKTLISNLRVSLAVLLMIVALSSLSAAQQYTVTDLGTLIGGETSDSAAINDAGQVVGYAGTSEASLHAFFWSNSSGMIDLGLLHSWDGNSFAMGINRSGTVVGTSGNYAFLWTQSIGMRDLGNLGGTGSGASWINNSGQVVGWSSLSDGSYHAFLWTAATGMQDLGSLGGNSIAYSINDSGQVVGFSWLSDGVTTHAFLWTETGGMQDLGTLGGASSGAAAINASGQIAGWSLTADKLQVAFKWDSTHGMQALRTPLQQQSFASGINQSGQIVGAVYSPGAAGSTWTKGGKSQNLNGLISHENGYINGASAINKPGQITGGGSKNHALLLTPTKQPSSQRSEQ
jgi:probable HAF family extracellular repeat protein